jgi:hypothetical protein
MSLALLKGAVVWLLLVVVAIANGLVRDAVLTPMAGSAVALPLSGVLLSLLVFLVAFVTVPWIGAARSAVYVSIGLLWVALALAFELGFGHYLLARPWGDIVRVFDLTSGDLFVLVLVVTGVSPWLAARCRGLA